MLMFIWCFSTTWLNVCNQSTTLGHVVDFWSSSLERNSKSWIWESRDLFPIPDSYLPQSHPGHGRMMWLPSPKVLVKVFHESQGGADRNVQRKLGKNQFFLSEKSTDSLCSSNTPEVSPSALNGDSVCSPEVMDAFSLAGDESPSLAHALGHFLTKWPRWSRTGRNHCLTR